MRKIVLLSLGLILLLIAVLLIAPGLVPSSVYKDKIEGQLSKELGRTVTIDGDIKVASFPFIRAKTNDVSVQNYVGFESENFIKIKELEAKIRLIPLFSKRVEIQGFNLEGAEIYLERKQNGEVNWIDPNAPKDVPTSTTQPSDDPFKRDGRFTSFDPQISAFSFSEGRLVFLDKINNETYDASEINGTLSLPSLNSALKTDISLLYQGEPVAVNLTLETPKAFLSGTETPYTLSLQTDFATVDAKGRFAESDNIDLIGEVNANISDIKKLTSFSPEKLPYTELLTSSSFKGSISYLGGVLNVTDSSIDIKGEDITAQYTGDAALSETPVLSGELKANIVSPQSLALSLAPYLETPFPQAALLGETNITANFSSDGTTTTANTLTFKTEGDVVSATFTGQGRQSEEFLSLSGNFEAALKDIQKAATASEMPDLLPYADLLGRINANGKLSLENQAVRISDFQADAIEGDVNGTFTGNISYDTAPKVNGQFDFDISDFLIVDQKLNLESPYSASVKTIKAQGNIATNNDVFSLTALTATLSDGLINAEFSGDADYAANKADALSLAGKLSGNVTDIRKLAALNGTDLPIDTDQGKIFETASISGNVKGTTQALALSDMMLAFDDIKGTGTINMAMSAARPVIDANLNLNGLDLRPYMASYSAQNPTGEIQPWSETPFNVEAFKAIDGNILISTPNVITDRLSLGQSDIKATLRNGVLKADMPNLALYGGGGRGDLIFDTSKSTPELTFNVSLDALNGEGFLGAVAGFTKIIGAAGTEISVKASGQSQAALMRSLNGQGQFGLTGGQIKGIDVVKFTTGLEDALKTRSLPKGLGANEVTAFNALDGLFSINNGVVSINEFDVSASGVSAQGLGTIDLGNQTIDFKLRPRLNNESAKGIGAFGIPLQFSGGFGSAAPSLDTEFLGQIVAGKAKAKLADTVSGRVKGPVGDILGGVIGGQSSSQPSSEDSEASKQPTSKDDVINNVIGGFLGGNKQTTEQKVEDKTAPGDDTEKTPEEEEKKDEKPDLKKALGSLFGE